METRHSIPKLATLASQISTAPNADDVLVNSKVTKEQYAGGVTDMCLWRWMRDPRVQFPHPIKINRRNFWRLSDLRNWQAARAQKSA